MKRFSFAEKCNWFEITTLRDCLRLNSRQVFVQSEVKPKAIVIGSHMFSRALRQLHVIESVRILCVGLELAWNGGSCGRK